jgi:hypothetical protein
MEEQLVLHILPCCEQRCHQDSFQTEAPEQFEGLWRLQAVQDADEWTSAKQSKRVSGNK